MVELIMVQILMLRRKINMEAFYASSGFLCLKVAASVHWTLQDLKPDLNLKRAPYFTSPLSLHVVDMNG